MSNFISIACLAVALLWPAVLNIIAYPISKKLSIKLSDYIVRVCAHRVFAILNTYKHFKFVGYPENKEKLPEQFLILSNHQSLVDIPLYMNFFRDKDLRFVAKDELARHVPLVSEMLRAHEHCMIPRRGSPVVAMATIENFGKRVLRKNEIPVLFPEGTRSKTGKLGKFYSAGFRKLSSTVNLPIVVCALDGGWRINNLRTIMTNMKDGYYRVKIVGILEAPQNKEEQLKVLDQASHLIEAQLEEWRYF